MLFWVDISYYCCVVSCLKECIVGGDDDNGCEVVWDFECFW